MQLGNHEKMMPSFVRFSRGILCGSLVGATLLTFGLVSFGIAVAIGVEKDDSIHGMSPLPIYVLAFGLAGGIVNLFEAYDALSFRSVLAWALAIGIVLLGCFLIVVVIREPVEWYWGVGSGISLFAMVTGARVVRSSPHRS
jgi:hypothetical protein